MRIDEAPPRIPVGEASNAAVAPLEGPTLIREIQRQLKRIGCYHGEATGVWTPAVRQSMRALTERANASLPVDQPDEVLLAMVQGQAPGACSAACPAGQGRITDGRCVPAALVAAEAPKVPRARPAASPERPRPQQPPTAAYRPMDGQMSLAGPRPKARPEVRHAAPLPRRPTRAQGRRSRSAYAPRRDRRAVRKQPSYGFSSLPGWAFPF